MARHDAGPLGQTNGFSLPELLAVLTIIGVLLAMAMPSYRQYVLRSNRSEAQALLVDAAARQARYYAQHRQYVTRPQALGELQLPRTQGNEVLSASGLYRLHVASGSGGFVLQAHPLGAQRADTACATLHIDGIGSTGSSGTASALECWK